jgi:hypothetical protein
MNDCDGLLCRCGRVLRDCSCGRPSMYWPTALNRCEHTTANPWANEPETQTQTGPGREARRALARKQRGQRRAATRRRQQGRG